MQHSRENKPRKEALAKAAGVLSRGRNGWPQLLRVAYKSQRLAAEPRHREQSRRLCHLAALIEQQHWKLHAVQAGEGRSRTGHLQVRLD